MKVQKFIEFDRKDRKLLLTAFLRVDVKAPTEALMADIRNIANEPLLRASCQRIFDDLHLNEQDIQHLLAGLRRVRLAVYRDWQRNPGLGRSRSAQLRRIDTAWALLADAADRLAGKVPSDV